jgi:hypothetical protein
VAVGAVSEREAWYCVMGFLGGLAWGALALSVVSWRESRKRLRMQERLDRAQRVVERFFEGAE